MKFDLLKAKRAFHKIDPLFPLLVWLSQDPNAETSISQPPKTASMPSPFFPVTKLTHHCGSQMIVVASV